MAWIDYIPEAVLDLYEVYDFHHAAAILCKEFPEEFRDICNALISYRFTIEDVLKPGGSESDFPKKFAKILRPLGWIEKQLKSKIVTETDDDIGVREVAQDTHKIDFIKNRVACDFEWNSKDQTFDRDLYVFRAFFDYDRISVGVLVTRGSEMKDWIRNLYDRGIRLPGGKPVHAKYGASTTHMGKLLPRLEAGRNGGCPILVFGITPRLLIEGDING